MTEPEFLDYCEEVHRKLVAYPKWRRGQAYINVLRVRFPGLEDEITGTDCDPFWDDTRIPYLLHFLMKLIVDEPEGDDATPR